MSYQPIENYGIIGNMRTAALIGMNGSIDWFCYPYFDSPSVFAAILDDGKGGRFQIAPTDDKATSRQFYWPDTNVLVTRFLTPDGMGELVDYMPVGLPHDRQKVIRRVTVTRGTMQFRVICEPAFNYARTTHELRLSENGAAFHTPELSMGLSTEIPLEASGKGVAAEFTLNEEETAVFIFDEIRSGGGCAVPLSIGVSEMMFQNTVDYWHRWLRQCTYTGRWREAVYRSALALKLLTFEPTGAIVAAPTASLPEGIGGERNWDYRYTWVRDGAFTLYALMRIGFRDEAIGFMDWLHQRIYEHDPDTPMQPLYGIDGRHVITEETLDHLEGYRGSSPVRIGNAAYKQLQLDIYGALMDSVYLYNKYVRFVSYDLWQQVRRVVDWVCEHWQQKDLGIWEVRSEPQDFVYSKLMSWVALDRGLRLASKRSLPAHHDRWLANRDQIYEQIMQHGWSTERGAFLQYYGGDTLDAANLIMPLVFFVAPDDNRMLSTIEAIMKPFDRGGLMAGEMVYRYNVHRSPDGLRGEEGTFNMCTFWLVEALTRAGKTDRARLIFERMHGYANHLGLYAEQTGLHGEALGNFPQGFTHLGLISAAFNLDRALDGNHLVT
ncbi:MAG: glycoside hydrolase family 15 protein [Anaerolineae bacterium]|nr:glycoside hydrolase family 15 protein [Anaerolineae bacterium]